MNPHHPLDALVQKVEAFRALHQAPGMLVMPNAWDAASARVFAATGFPAIATTSGGVAQALGYADHEGAPADAMFDAAGRIAAAVNVPVSIDLEAGYRLAPAEIVRRVIAAGGVGLNLEDSNHQGPGRLVPAEEHAERLAAVVAAARAEGVPLVLNARVDVFIARLGEPEEQLAEGLRRAHLYRAAGADCIYPIALRDEDALATMVAAVGPVNAMMRRGGPLSVARLAEIGVRRVTYATSMFRETIEFVEQMAQDVFGSLPPTAIRREMPDGRA